MKNKEKPDGMLRAYIFDKGWLWCKGCKNIRHYTKFRKIEGKTYYDNINKVRCYSKKCFECVTKGVKQVIPKRYVITYKEDLKQKIYVGKYKQSYNWVQDKNKACKFSKKKAKKILKITIPNGAIIEKVKNG